MVLIAYACMPIATYYMHCPPSFLCRVCACADTVKTSADAAAREQLAKVVEVLVRDKVASFEDCIAWARLKFQVRIGKSALDYLASGYGSMRLLFLCCTNHASGCHAEQASNGEAPSDLPVSQRLCIRHCQHLNSNTAPPTPRYHPPYPAGLLP